MDVLTQLDSALDLLLSIMSSSIAYTSRKAIHMTLPSSTIPLTILGKTEAISVDEMDEAISELVTDLVEKAESIRSIILHLPTEEALGGEQELKSELDGLQREMQEVNMEYKRVVKEVDELKKEVEDSSRFLGDRLRDGRGWLVRELEESKEQSQETREQ
ncbi:uncharacterized protein UTRI_01728 [Ustilago trichophora]|uniref:Mediator of RNA polymerase II transcription subunit 21 n=1 Tax=Ustilago trichophora TaxID=86804 RepID=A0A5C3DZF6_9BASI|nr:uncharacterized protein UTRI_01728 [Ustilago trichophora]